MSKFNTRRKVSKSRKHLVKTVKRPKLSTDSTVCQLEKNLERRQPVFRESKYRKKTESNIRKIITKKSTTPA